MLGSRKCYLLESLARQLAVVFSFDKTFECIVSSSPNLWPLFYMHSTKGKGWNSSEKSGICGKDIYMQNKWVLEQGFGGLIENWRGRRRKAIVWYTI
jgi:hypothetical protein